MLTEGAKTPPGTQRLVDKTTPLLRCAPSFPRPPAGWRQSEWDRPHGELWNCVFRANVTTIPKSFRSAFRNYLDHDSGMKPITHSDIQPVSFGRMSE
jgi:hypothetical protein